jgi:hypothetical protein
VGELYFIASIGSYYYCTGLALPLTFIPVRKVCTVCYFKSSSASCGKNGPQAQSIASVLDDGRLELEFN